MELGFSLTNFNIIDFGAGLIIFWIASSAVESMPEPGKNGNKFYLWFYKFTHSLLANWGTLRNLKRRQE